MEKSIETIWKAGFLRGDALVAPQVNDLYNRKSEHIIEKFNRMFRFNLKAIAIGGILGVFGFTAMQLPITGIVLSLVLLVVFVVNRKELNGLEKIDKSVSSFEYLQAFDSWLKSQVAMNRRMARFYYPILFLGTSLGVWFSVHGPRLYEIVVGLPSEGWLLNGIPGILLFPILLIAGLLAIFGGRLYALEIDTFYGRVFTKMEELLADMEKLRQE